MKLFDDVSNVTASSKIYGVLFLISFFSYMFFNQAIPITDPVESNYALTAKEMVLSGDWVSPRIYGNVWFDKPIFFYWLTALSFQLFGFSEWAARLAPALFAAVGVVLLYWFAGKTITRRSALLAVVIMGTSFEYLLLAKLVITDMVFFVFNCAALGFFYMGYVKMDGTKRWYLAAYVSMALAVLTKGPIGALLPALVILLVILLQRNWTELKEMYPLTGFLLFAIVALPWYAAMYTLHGMEFINTFFGVHNYLRATVSEHPKDNVSYYYLAVFVLSMLPWSALVTKALIQGYKDFCSRKSPLLLFLFLWIAAYFGFYSLMATKYLTYTFPILFPVAILTAIQLERMLAQGKMKEIFYWIGVPVALLMVGYMIAAYRYLAGWELGLTTAGLLLFLVFSVWKARNRTAVDVFKLFCLCQLGSYIILSLFIFPIIAESRSGKEIARSMVDLGVEKIGMYQFYSTSAVFYSGKVAVKLISPSQVTFRQAEELDWSSKYTMPTQRIADFGAKPPLSDRLIIVRGKQREQFQLETARLNYRLLKDSKGLSYFSIKE
ncbi:ArnT family glycosyltransferase [Pelosinus propionicus]|uniref:4-amino-4-deoxy-L-arabinose transferase n=1 Tax=Pelosinus propionicus DSM 13327 TaxID=1123291 RepID=A0A1I4IKE1_9FIRM|nr:glycosyltransferase family 39 protein [Pelosinus propionicus]SFL54832.1 4-amino-4-deoxy-L-arabinose transferase [Pelosinus propionicus DSM 13327]